MPSDRNLTRTNPGSTWGTVISKYGNPAGETSGTTWEPNTSAISFCWFVVKTVNVVPGRTSVGCIRTIRGAIGSATNDGETGCGEFVVKKRRFVSAMSSMAQRGVEDRTVIKAPELLSSGSKSEIGTTNFVAALAVRL